MQVENNPLSDEITRLVEKATGQIVVSAATLAGGVADAKIVVLHDGLQVVVKVAKGKGEDLAIEGATSEYLNKQTELPMPYPYYSGSEALVHEYVIADGTLQTDAEESAVQNLIKLHSITSDAYGFDFDTLYCGVRQPNNKKDKWIPFFIENRLLFMARTAFDSGRLPLDVMKKIEAFCEKVDAYLIEPERPSLLHGNISSSTVLCHHGRVKAFVDPAIFFGDREFEFAYAGETPSLSPNFLKKYNETNPFKEGYFEYRQSIYNLYPLLFDVLHFGDRSLPIITATLHRFGF